MDVLGKRPLESLPIFFILRHFNMSSVTNPAEKKRLAYQKDHYVRGGASPQNWRKVKSFKKAKASRAFRKLHKSLEPVCADDEEAPSPPHVVSKD